MSMQPAAANASASANAAHGDADHARPSQLKMGDGWRAVQPRLHSYWPLAHHLVRIQPLDVHQERRGVQHFAASADRLGDRSLHDRASAG